MRSTHSTSTPRPSVLQSTRSGVRTALLLTLALVTPALSGCEDETEPLHPDTVPPGITVTESAFEGGDLTVTLYVNERRSVASLAYRVEDGPRTPLEYTEDPFTFTIADLPYGPVEVTLLAVDGAGNEGSLSLEVERPDDVPPVLELATPRDGAVMDTAGIRLAGTATDGYGIAEIRWSFEDAGAGSPAGASLTFDGPGEAAFDTLIAVPSGPFTLAVTALDAAGNEAVSRRDVRIDTVPPAVAATRTATGDRVRADSAELELIATDSSGIVSANWSLDDGPPHPLAIEPAVEVVQVIDLPYLEEGEHQVTLRATDAAGNRGSTQLILRADASQPEVDEVVFPDGTVVTDEGFAFEIVTDDPDDVQRVTALVDGSDLRVLYRRAAQMRQGDGSAGEGASEVRTDAGFRFELQDLGEGDHTLEICVEDAVGNRSCETVSMVVDGEAPAVTIDRPSRGDSVPADSAILEASVSDNDALRAIRWRSDQGPWNQVPPSGTLTGFTRPLGTLSPGDHRVTVEVTDRSGQSTVASMPFVAVATGPAPDTADLSLRLSSGGPLEVGDTLRIGHRVVNSGPDTARSLSLTDSIPGSLSPLPHPSCTPSGVQVQCDMGTLAPGDTVSLTLALLATAPDTGNVPASVASASVDPATADNSTLLGFQVAPLSSGAPTATITSPADSSLSGSAQLTVSGQLTDDNAVSRATSEVNGGGESQITITTDDTVQVSHDVTLQSGWNRVVLRGYDAQDQVGADTVNVRFAEGPVARLGTGGSTTAGQPATFDASNSSDPQGLELTYRWTFGDGDRGGAESLAHIYDAAGTYDVRLVVTNDAGLADTASTTLSISAPTPPATLNGTVEGVILDASGDSLPGVTVTHPGTGASGITDSQGSVTLNGLPEGPPQILTLRATGYLDNQVSVTLEPGVDGWFRARMVPAGPAETLTDAEDGGTVTGSDGATFEVPADALVDGNGDPVSGDVTVTSTPIDVSGGQLDAFPGGFGAVDGSGNTGVLASYGVVDFTVDQNGQELDLAPGAEATIRIPIYTGGASPGQSIALWSLDESNGVWIQEGSGTVVNAPGSPTGLALEATIGHLSWWNCDAFNDPYRPEIKLLTPNGSPIAGQAAASTRGANGPRSSSYAGVDPAGTSFDVWPDTDIYVDASANNGLLAADTVIRGAAGASDVIDITLESVTFSTQDTLRMGDSIQAAIDPSGEVDEYAAVGPDGSLANIRVKTGGNSNLEGDVVLLTASGDTLNRGTFEGGFTPEAAELFTEFGTSARQLKVDGTGFEPGAYDVVVEGPDTLPVRVETSTRIPYPGAVGYVFDLPSTDSLRVSLEGGHSHRSSGDCLDVTIRRADGTGIFSDTLECTASGTDENVDTILSVPGGGEYELIARNLLPGAEWAADITVEDWNPIQAAVDTTVTADIPAEGLAYVAVPVQAGDTLALGSDYEDVELVVLDENFDVVPVPGFQIPDVYPVTADGTWFVRMTEDTGDRYTGTRPVRLGISRITTRTLSLSRDVVSDTLARPGDRHFYRFTTGDAAGLVTEITAPTEIDGINLIAGVIGSGTPLAPEQVRRGTLRFDNSSTLPGDRRVGYREKISTGGGTAEYQMVVQTQEGDTGPYTLTANHVESTAAITVDDDLACSNAGARSFRAALLAMQDGGTLTVCSGVYDGPLSPEVQVDDVRIVGDAPSGVVIRSYDKPALRGDGIRGLVVDSLTLETDQPGGLGDVVSLGNAADVTFREVTVRRQSGGTAPSTGITFEGDTLRVLSSTFESVGEGVEGRGAPSAVTIWNSTFNTMFGGVELEGGHDVVIEENAFTHTGSSAHAVRHETGQFSQDGGGVRIVDNVISMADAGTAVQVEENGTGTQGSVVQGNEIEILHSGSSNDIEAFFLEQGVTDATTLVDGNTVRLDTGEGGTFARIFAGRTNGTAGTVILRNNTVEGMTFEGLRIDAAHRFDDIAIHNNTMVGADTGYSNDFPLVIINEFDSPQGRLPVAFANNIVAGSPVQSEFGIQGNAGDTIQADHNLFVNLGAGTYDGGIVSSLASGSSSPVGANTLLGQDPSLDATLHLQSGSAAIDAGSGDLTLFPTLPTVDIDGEARPRGAGYDIGADEGG